ncbi:MAG: chaperonin family protein RbcX [Leptolyngbyaceae bacterium]|nr:chaperonin family protein RbcX [Leptolyngbyaceae bacterium]
MNLKQIAKDTAKVLTSYLTYQALRTVLAQLSETNPPLAFWLSNFSATSNVQDGEAYLQDLMRENQELAFRIMTVREHLAQEVTDFLPEMVRTGIQAANMDHRRQYLERVTQLHLSDPVDPSSDETSTGSKPDLDELSS